MATNNYRSIRVHSRNLPISGSVNITACAQTLTFNFPVSDMVQRDGNNDIQAIAYSDDVIGGSVTLVVPNTASAWPVNFNTFATVPPSGSAPVTYVLKNVKVNEAIGQITTVDADFDKQY